MPGSRGRVLRELGSQSASPVHGSWCFSNKPAPEKAGFRFLSKFELYFSYFLTTPLQNIRMDEVSLQFHIEQNDYFGTLATVLDLVSQSLQQKGEFRNAETLLRSRDGLMRLPDGLPDREKAS
jgi:hypothetical protein